MLCAAQRAVEVGTEKWRASRAVSSFKAMPCWENITGETQKPQMTHGCTLLHAHAWGHSRQTRAHPLGIQH